MGIFSCKPKGARLSGRSALSRALRRGSTIRCGPLRASHPGKPAPRPRGVFQQPASVPGATAAASPAADSPPYLAVALLSAAALAYEVLLTRLFSIVQWYHFAYMMISVALLGYGAAGTTVALLRERFVARSEQVFALGAALFALTAVGGFLAAQRVPFNALEFLWDPRQSSLLLAIYGLLFVPFYCAALGLCTAFTRFAADAPRLYSFDIGGAAVGCLGVIGMLFAFAPMTVLRLVGVLALAAAWAAWRYAGKGLSLTALPIVAAAAILVVLPARFTPLAPSEFKELPRTLEVTGTRVLAERWSPLGLLTVVESRSIPFRNAPGLSLASAYEPPPQLAVFTDAAGFSTIDHYSGDASAVAYLDYVTSAAPYHLLDRPRVLVLGSGTGTEVLAASAHGAKQITAVELNPQIIALVEDTFGDFSGRPYALPGVTFHLGEARGFAAGTDARFDLIQIAFLDAFGASSAGVYSLAESYLYTVEALALYLTRLAPGGLLVITRWLTLPPRDTLKLFATAIAALERAGVRQPGKRLALIRGLRTTTLLVKNGEFTATEIERLQAFCRARSFDTAYYPGITPGQGERYNRLDQPYFTEGTQALLGPDREAFIARYKFAIAPATDDRPYFFHFFRWASLPELMRLRDRGGMPLIEWGYPMLVATLVQAALLSAVLIVVPLLGSSSRRTRDARTPPRWRVARYFGALGFAFMFLEIAFIQKFILFLFHPLYAIAVVLCGFLLFAGVGSRYAARFAVSDAARTVKRAVFAIACVAGIYLLVLPNIVASLASWSDPARIAVALALIAPLAFPMGMPFPLGLARTNLLAPALVPWAWGINACASVIAAILATLLAMHFGFSAVVLMALVLYGIAAATLPRITEETSAR